MYSVSYESAFTLLKKRIWQVCNECNFERNSEEFKKFICCAWQHFSFSKQFLIQIRHKK